MKNQSNRLPQHVAIIMDGNRRWAREKGLPVFQGHKLGEEKIDPIVDAAINMGIPFLTFWAFSTENWNRSKQEVNFLLNLYGKKLDKKVSRFHQKNVKVNVIGNLSLFPNSLQQKTKQWMEKTRNNKRLTLNFALSYGGRDEILRAIGKIIKEVKNGQWSEKDLTAQTFSSYLDTAGQPEPDLLIRTGGTQRLSGFMLWQLEYTELYFTRTYWPDFTPEKFRLAIDDFLSRQRRFGQ